MSSTHNYKGILYLTLLLVILPVAVWNFSIKKTVTKWQSYREESKELAEIESRDYSGLQTTPELQEELISSGGFIKAIAAVADKNGIMIEKYTPFVTYHTEGIQVNSAELLMAGNYIPLVRMIDHIENNMTTCKLVSVNFNGTEDRRTGIIKLTATIVVQQLTDLKNTSTI